MKRALAAPGLCCAVLAWPVVGTAANSSTAEDRFTLMASGSTLTNTNGGWGASAGWLHNFSADTLVGIGGEHQTIGDADWNFGSLNFSHGMGQASHRTTLYAEAHEGSGKDKTHSYDYSIVTAGLYQNLTRQLILQLEDKQIDVDNVDGNLPKVGVQYLWSPAFSSTVAHARSVTGGLDTQITTVRVDGYTKTLTAFAGAATGQASPVLIDRPVNFPTIRTTLHEYYVGAGRSFSRADMVAVLDYSKLGASEHWTLSFSCVVHRRRGG